jgi:serine/threonine protein phosphatase 1
MSTYCLSDIHGCYDEFRELLEKISFTPGEDTLYVLGDAIDRGDRPLDCLNYIRKTKGVHFLLGNHELMMLLYYGGHRGESDWDLNGNGTTKAQFKALSEAERGVLFTYLLTRPRYKTLLVGDRRYFLSHAGLSIGLPFNQQTNYDLVWSREEFYEEPVRTKHTYVFGHTITPLLHSDFVCGVWLDGIHSDKIGIDCGCVYGGALAALRLDDGKVFYVKARPDRGSGKTEISLQNSIDQIPAGFYANRKR